MQVVAAGRRAADRGGRRPSASDWQPIELVGAAPRAGRRQRGADRRGSRRADVRLVPRHRPGHGAARARSGCRHRCRLVAGRCARRLARRPLDQALSNVANYAIFPLVGGALIQLVARSDVTPARRTRSAFAALVLLVFMVTNSLNFVDGRRLLNARRKGLSFCEACGRSTSRCSRPSSRRGCSPPAWPSATARSVLAPSACSLSCSSSSSTSSAPCIEAHRARRGTREADPRAGLAAGRPPDARCCRRLSMRDAMTARHSAAVARYAARSPSMIGRRRARAGPHPHGRPAPRHRQVHLPRLDPLRRAQAHRRGVGDRQAPPGAGREARPSHRGVRPRRRHHLLPSRALRRQRLLQGAARGHPARLAHHRGGGHVRRHDLARLLPPPGELRGGARRAPSGRRQPARSRSSWTTFVEMIARARVSPSITRTSRTSSWSSRSIAESRTTRARAAPSPSRQRVRFSPRRSMRRIETGLERERAPVRRSSQVTFTFRRSSACNPCSAPYLSCSLCGCNRSGSRFAFLTKRKIGTGVGWALSNMRPTTGHLRPGSGPFLLRRRSLIL